MKLVALVMAILLPSLQTPSTFAAEPIEQATGVSVPVASVDGTTQAVTTDTTVQTAQESTTTSFLANDQIVYPIPPTEPPIAPTEEPIPIEPLPTEIIDSPEVAAIKAIVTTDLVNSFALTQEVVDNAIKEGLIKISVDLTNLTAMVTIDPSVQLSDQVDLVYLADLLESGKLPGEIHYQLGLSPIQPLAPCTVSPDGTSICPPPSYQLESGSFQVGDQFFELNYLPPVTTTALDGVMGDNRLHSVKIYPNFICVPEVCSIGALVKEMSYQYDDATNSITAHIVYYDGSQGKIASRDVEIARMEDGQYHIQAIADLDKEGRVIAKSTFTYVISVPYCDPANGCSDTGVHLHHITRTDANGNLLSTISDIQLLLTIAIYPSSEPAYGATIVRADGLKTQVTFQTLEQLFMQALKFERMKKILPPPVSNQKQSISTRDYLNRDTLTSVASSSSIDFLSRSRWYDPFLILKRFKKKK